MEYTNNTVEKSQKTKKGKKKNRASVSPDTYLYVFCLKGVLGIEII